jgi:hypothetical protein
LIGDFQGIFLNSEITYGGDGVRKKGIKKTESVGPVPMAARSEARVYGHSLAGIAGSNPAEGIDICLL